MCEAVQQQSSVDPVEVISSVNEIQVKIHTQEKIQDQDTFQEERRSSWDLSVVVRVGFVRNSIPHTHTIQLSIVVCCQGECVIQAGQVVWYNTEQSKLHSHCTDIFVFICVKHILVLLFVQSTRNLSNIW